jgi:hypothetical protein
MGAAVPGANRVRCLTAFYSSYALARLGPTCQIAIPRTRHAIRFQHWVRSGVTRGVLAGLAEDLRLRGRFPLEEVFIDGSFAPAKKGGAGVGKTKRATGTKIMAVADGTGLPVAVCVESATPHEITVVQQTLSDLFVAEPIEHLIGDNAYDSGRLDRELADTGSR